MTPERINLLLEDQSLSLTQEEIDQGWHFCREMDGELQNPDEEYLPWCWCLGRPGKATEPKTNISEKPFNDLLRKPPGYWDRLVEENEHLKRRVKELEGNQAVWLAKESAISADNLRQAARIRELEQAMPLPEMFRHLNLAYIELGFAKEGEAFVRLADRIEAVMRKGEG